MRIKVFLLFFSLSQHGIRAKGENLILSGLSSFPCHQLRETFRWPCFIPVTFPISQYFPVSRNVVRNHSPPAKFSGELFRQPIFPTPTIPEGAPGGDLQLLWRHRHQKSIHAPTTRHFPAGGYISRAGAWGRVRHFPATRLLLQLRLTPTSLPTSLVLPSKPYTYLFWGFLSPSALQTVFPAKLRLLFLHPNPCTCLRKCSSTFPVVPRRDLKPSPFPVVPHRYLQPY